MNRSDSDLGVPSEGAFLLAASNHAGKNLHYDPCMHNPGLHAAQLLTTTQCDAQLGGHMELAMVW